MTSSPDDTSTSNGMATALNDAASVMRDVRAPGQLHESDLAVDHPYGDGKSGETGSATLARLGAGRQYGSNVPDHPLYGGN